jgi:hypothetical protein
LTLGKRAFERLTCLPSSILDILAQQSRVTHHEHFCFTGTAAVKG